MPTMSESQPSAKMAAWKLPTDLLAEVKAVAVVTDTTQQEIVAAALAEWLERQRPRLTHSNLRMVNMLKNRYLQAEKAGRET